METNTLKAINNISQLDSFALSELYEGQNRMNNVGTAFEYFVKDMFCSTIGVTGLEEKRRMYANYLSYAGNQNNPPDFILQRGDAVEVKKIGGLTGSLALNSSYPKSKLHSDDVRILQSCRDCDGGDWVTKDMLYVVGTITDSQIRVLWLVYGDCYAANREVYERIFLNISSKVHEVENIEFAETNELAGVRNVDPLGITHLRVRGMWGIETPHSVFGSFTKHNSASGFSAYAVILEEKYESFPEEDRAQIEANPAVAITEVEIPSPNNPAQYLVAKLISIRK